MPPTYWETCEHFADKGYVCAVHGEQDAEVVELAKVVVGGLGVTAQQVEHGRAQHAKLSNMIHMSYVRVLCLHSLGVTW